MKNNPSIPLLPTYEHLFQESDYYTVLESNSVLSPGAYFLELKQLINKYIEGETVFARRPDLSKLVFDEASTFNPVKKLEIVNKVLKEYLDNEGKDNLNATYPFNLPYNLAHDEIKQYLLKNKTSLFQLQQKLKKATIFDGQSMALEALGISYEFWGICNTPITTLKGLNTTYGLSSTKKPKTYLSIIENFLSQTGLSWTQLELLLYQDLSPEGLSLGLNKQFYINAATPKTSVKINQKSQTLTGLSVNNLDRMNRFVRLTQALNWSFIDLDWALRTAAKVNKLPTPKINNSILSTLAWIYYTSNKYQITVDESCALIGTLKDFGTKNGPSFFSSVFENPLIPNCPKDWSKEVWNPENTDPSNQQIQNALANALQLTQSELLAIGCLMKNNSPTSPIPLNEQNLAIFYRLSKTSKLLGLTVNEMLVSANLCSIKENELVFPITKSSNKTEPPLNPNLVFAAAFERLSTFTAWIKTSPFNVYEVQFILEGKSEDPKINNTIIGSDAVNNFKKELKANLSHALLTKDVFVKALNSYGKKIFLSSIEELRKLKGHKSYYNKLLSNATYWSNVLLDAMYDFLVDKKIIDKGIVSEKVPLEKIDESVLVRKLWNVFKKNRNRKQLPKQSDGKPITIPPLPNDFEVSKLGLIVDLLNNYFHQQQKIFITQLASLYKVPNKIATTLNDWGNLNIDSILNSEKDSVQKHQSLLSYVHQVDNADISNLVTRLQKLQQAALLITGYQLSSAEAKYFKVDYHPTNQYPISLSTIKTIEQFKKLVKSFADTQNNLLTILGGNVPEKISDVAKQLAKLTGWQQNQINLFGTEDISIETIANMQQYFITSNLLGIDINTLQSLLEVSSKTESSLANALWAGLQKKYSPNELAGIQGYLKEALRDRLVPMTMGHNHAEWTNPRDLYEYFLIDVEVSSVVETSIVKEGISALQLYIYRCLNQLESGTTCDPELTTIWTWMYAYREWQANKEVLIWPENYIQPELRKNVSPQFAKLESALKQADLTNPDTITSIFQNYMNGFEEVATLQIVGSAGRDVSDGNIYTKEICLVGKTKRHPSHYYYRVATFIRSENSDQYTPLNWGCWEKINISIQPAAHGAVTPVFAFGKWYIFWVEEKQHGSQKDSNGNQQPLYQTQIQYSHLDFSKRWVAAQTVQDSVITNKTSRINISQSVVYPFYFSSAQLLCITFNSQTFKININTLGNDCIEGSRYESSSPPINILDNANNNFHYYSALGDESIENGAKSLSTWFWLENTDKTSLTPNISVQAGMGIFINGASTPLSGTNGIKENEWNHLAVTIDGIFLNKKKIKVHGNEFVSFYVGTSAHGLYGKVSTGFSQVGGIDSSARIRNYYVFEGVLYVGTNDGLYKNNGTGFSPVTEVPTTVSIQNYYVFKSVLYVGTNGGLYKNEGTGFSPVSEIPNTASIQNYYVFDGVLYVGTGGGLYKNEGTGFSSVSEVPTTVSIQDYYVFKGVLYVGMGTGGGLYNNEGTGFSLVSEIPNTVSIQNYYIFDDVLYVGTGGGDGKGSHGLYKNDGAGFSPVSNIPNTASIQNYYVFEGVLYVGTNGGLYKNDGTGFSLVSKIPNTASIENYYVFEGVFYVGTEAHGLYEKGATTGFSQVAGVEPSAEINYYYVFEGVFYVGTSAHGLYEKGGTGFSQVGGVEPSADILNYYTNSCGIMIKTTFNGLLQETLYFNQSLSDSQLIELYENSKDYITQDCESTISPRRALNGAFTTLPILMQPNWNIVLGNQAEYLLSPYSNNSNSPLLYPYRLNTTAINKLSHLLHQPKGIQQLLTIVAQGSAEIPFADLQPNLTYIPDNTCPKDNIDFSQNAAMADYYWELFFHTPFLIARELNLHQQFKQAKQWYQYIFNPSITDALLSTIDKYWRFKGLRSADNPVLKQELEENYYEELQSDLINPKDIYLFDNDPFDPHALAAIRPIAYQKTIVTHYIDNLINWGDQLFRENTRESIVEAEMQYVEAYDILGNEPRNLGKEMPSVSLIKINSGTDNFTCVTEFKGSIYAGTEGNGLIVSSDNGLTWKACTSSSSSTFKTTRITCLFSDANVLLAGTFANGLWSYNIDKNDWSQLPLGNSITFRITCIDEYQSTYFVGTYTQGIWGVNNIEGDWIQQILPPPKPKAKVAYGAIKNFCSNPLGFFVSVYADPIKDKYVIGGCYQYEAKNKWTLVSSKSGGLVQRIYSTQSNLYITTWDSGFYELSSNDKPPTKIPLKDGPIHLYFVLKNGNKLFISSWPKSTTSDGKGLWWSPDTSIKEWQQVVTIPPTATVTSIQSVGSTIYVGTKENGLWVSPNNGETWSQPIEDLQKVAINNIQVIGSSVYISSNGEGIYKYNSFSIPRNQQFLNYWDIVKQRLYNIRNGLDINGNIDQLPLFQPAINPMELVSAIASGEGVQEAVSSTNIIVPYYRFAVIIEKAKSLAQSCIQLGQSILSTLEKEDAEKLSVLLQTNQYHILQLSQSNKQDQITLAEQNIKALQAGLQTAEDRKNHYQKLISNGYSPNEQKQIKLQSDSVIAQDVVEGIKAASIAGYLLPSIFGFSDGGMKFGDAINQGAEIAQHIGNILSQNANLAAIIGGFQRRAEDWQLQETLALDDMNQMNLQILASQYQKSLAEKELELLITEIEQSGKVADFYKKKFTNEQLYQWYKGQVSSLFFQSYSLAHEVAIQAENAWHFEHIGRFKTQNLSFIKPAYWNGLYDGLLSGESLLLDLQRMEKAFMDENVRPLEIEKTFSLALMQTKKDPIIKNLRDTGQCTFDFLEKDFATDFPGHYCRKIKTLSVSIPMVVGPYQNIPATLIQLSNRIITTDDEQGIAAVKALLGKKSTNSDGGVMKLNVRPNQQVALSTGVNDFGMFTLNFNDERYLPFEGTGALSSWLLELNIDKKLRDTLTDVIIQVKYTALPANAAYKDAVIGALGNSK